MAGQNQKSIVEFSSFLKEILGIGGQHVIVVTFKTSKTKLGDGWGKSNQLWSFLIYFETFFS